MRRSIFPFLAFAGLAVAAFGRAAGHELLFWDDLRHLCQNPLIFPPERAGFAEIWSKPFFDLYIPVSYSVWWVLVQLGSLTGLTNDCQDYAPLLHGFNIFLQAVNAFLIFKWLHLVLEKYVPYDSKNLRIAIWLGALIFLFHPLQVESVAWVSGMRDLLSMFFLLSAMIVYFRDYEKSGFWRRYAKASVLFAAALLSKPSAAAVPAIFFVLETLIYDQGPVRAALRMLPWALTGAALGIYTSGLQSNEALIRPDFVQRIAIVFFSAGYHLFKVVIPYPLAADYAFPLFELVKAAWLLPLAGALSILLALAIWWLEISKSRILLTALLIFLVGILPVSGLVDFSFQRTSQVADRFTYLPMLGVALTFAWLYMKNFYFQCGLPVFAITFFLMSFQQTAFWQTDLSLFAHSVKMIPQGSTAQGNLGQALYNRGRYAEAEPHLKQSLQLDPNNREAAITLGRSLEKQNKIQEAIDFYRTLISTGRNWAAIHNNLAVLLSTYSNDKGLAMQHYRMAADLDPNYFEPRLNMGTTLLELGELAEAQTYLEAARRLNPNHPVLVQAITDLTSRLTANPK